MPTEIETKALVAAKRWRYAINYGPDGEENYANVYDAEGYLVSNLRTHHAMEIVETMNRLAALESPIGEQGVDPHHTLHIYEGDGGVIIRDGGNISTFGVQSAEVTAAFNAAALSPERKEPGWTGDEINRMAEAIDAARYAHPRHPRVPERSFAEADRGDREYAFRLARAAFAVLPTPGQPT